MAAKQLATTTVPALNPKYGIRSRYAPSQDSEEYKALQWVYQRYNAMKMSTERQLMEPLWDKWERQWEAWRPDRAEDEWQSNHTVPITTGTVEAAMAEMIDQNSRPLILPRTSEDKGRAQVMKLIFDFSWEAADGDVELFNLIKDALMLGTAIGQEYYWADKRMVQMLKALGKDNKPEYEEVEQVDFDGCYFECVKLQDFFVDERARTLNMGPYQAVDCIRRYIMDIDAFKIAFSGPFWDHLDNAKYVEPGGDTNYYEFYKPPERINKDRDVEVLWYWSTKPKDSLIIVANDIPVVVGPNPYKHKRLPFVRAVDIKRTHKFYGKGEAELLESIQDEMNTSRRMMIDRNHLDIDKMFTGSSRIELDEEDLISRPHAFFPSDDPGGLKPIEYGDVPRSVQLGKEWLQEDAVRATGIDDRMASNQPGNSTATEAALVKENYLKRIRMKVRIIERETLIPLARLRVCNILQFYTQPELEEIIGEKNNERYAQELATLHSQGLLHMVDGKPYKINYREIRTENKKVDFDTKGKLMIVPEKGMHFFLAKPEYYTPKAKMYDFRFAAGSSLPISKPLQQTKAMEMYDRLLPLALNNVGYDPVKLGDLLLEVNDYDPSEYHLEQVNQENDQADQRLQTLVNLAMFENQQMLGGKAMPATPYSTPAHTLIHIKFMQSEQFQKLPNTSPIIKIFTEHVVGELAFQQMRGQQAPTMMQGGQQAPGMPTPQDALGDNPANPAQADLNKAKQTPPAPLNKADIIPGAIQGGERKPI